MQYPSFASWPRSCSCALTRVEGTDKIKANTGELRIPQGPQPDVDAIRPVLQRMNHSDYIKDVHLLRAEMMACGGSRLVSSQQQSRPVDVVLQSALNAEGSVPRPREPAL